MKKIIFQIIFLLFMSFFLMSCANMDPMSILKANDQVRQFFSQYPNADVTMIRLAENKIENENLFVSEICNIELEIKPHYKVTIIDPDSNLDIYAYMDVGSNDIICVKKIGTQEEKLIENEEITIEDIDKDDEVKEQFGKYFPNPDNYPEYYNKDNEIHDAYVLHRKHLNCNDDSPYEKAMKGKEEQIIPIYDNNGKKIYFNYVCENRKQQQCYDDGSFDTYYDEWCEDKDGNRIGLNPIVPDFPDDEEIVEDNVDEEQAVNEEVETEDCVSPISLSYAVYENEVYLEWDEYECPDFEGYKVVWSENKQNPKYPEDGYVEFITESDVTSITDNFRGKKNHYSITVLAKNGKEYSNSIHFEVEPEENEEECDDTIELTGVVDGSEIVLKWNPYICDSFNGYKIVWSDTVENPKYPENSYIEYITDNDVTTYKDELRGEENFYAITVLTENGKVYSNPIRVKVENYEENEIDYYGELNYEYEDDKLILTWNPYTGDDLEFYKIVWSQDKSDIQYPEDGYIKAITDKNTVRYVVNDANYKSGMNNYRITAVFEGFYPNNKESKRVNSNVLSIEKIDTP